MQVYRIFWNRSHNSGTPCSTLYLANEMTCLRIPLGYSLSWLASYLQPSVKCISFLLSNKGVFRQRILWFFTELKLGYFKNRN